MIKILITGYYGFFNSGDDAILTSMCSDIRALDMKSEITIISNNPLVTKKEYKTESAYRFDFKSVIRKIKETDILLMGGGSLLQDRTSTKSLIYYLSILWLAKKFNKKCMIYANGIGPIRRKFNRYITKKVLNKVDVITLREKLSEKELYKLGVNKPIVKVTADPVFNLQTMDINVDDILAGENIDTSKPFAAILFRNWKDESKYVKKIAKVCDYIVKTYDMNILFIPMKYPADISVSKSISNKMECNSYILEKQYDVNTIIQIIGQTKIVLSMRLHALLYATLKGIPMVGFIYDPKVKYFLEELEMNTISDIRDFEVNEVINHIDKMLETYDEFQVSIKEKARHLKGKAYGNRKYLNELIQMKKAKINDQKNFKGKYH